MATPALTTLGQKVMQGILDMIASNAESIQPRVVERGMQTIHVAKLAPPFPTSCIFLCLYSDL
jgi:hypothetical protein